MTNVSLNLKVRLLKRNAIATLSSNILLQSFNRKPNLHESYSATVLANSSKFEDRNILQGTNWQKPHEVCSSFSQVNDFDFIFSILTSCEWSASVLPLCRFQKHEYLTFYNLLISPIIFGCSWLCCLLTNISKASFIQAYGHISFASATVICMIQFKET